MWTGVAKGGNVLVGVLATEVAPPEVAIEVLSNLHPQPGHLNRTVGSPGRRKRVPHVHCTTLGSAAALTERSADVTSGMVVEVLGTTNTELHAGHRAFFPSLPSEARIFFPQWH